MNDGPGLAAWDLARERCAAADEARREELDRLCKSHPERLERDPDAKLRMKIAAMQRELRRREKRAATVDKTPVWPTWALSLSLLTDGHCAACGKDLTGNRGGPANRTHLCGRCQQRAGRDAVRMALAVRMFKAGEWRP